MEIVEYDQDTGAPLRLNGEYVRDEAGQATYLRELLEIFDAEGVDSAFVFLFALDSLPHRPGGDPRDDLDLASPGIVKVSRTAAETPTPTCPGSPRPPSPPSPSTTAADHDGPRVSAVRPIAPARSARSGYRPHGPCLVRE